MLRRCSRLLAVVAAGALLAPASAAAQGPLGPLNDLLALGQAGGQTPLKLPLLRRAEPPLVATPRAKCAPGGRPEPGIQGRIPAGAATNGLRCNITQVAHQGRSGGFRVWRYTDETGRVCAFYDTALLFPLNALQLSGDSLGVAVLDMSDPAHPVQTDSLTELPMLSPHESLNVNARRGLIAAVLGNPATYPGLVSIYDAHKDCRHPVLQSTSLVARFGHESGFSPDGNTFYAAGTAVQAITAIDVTNPKTPHAIWQGNVSSHGLSVSDNGNRIYIADATGGNMAILDTSEIQARKANPQAREVSRLTWGKVSIPQNALPFTRDGHAYILEFDEYTGGTTGGGSRDDVGAARIIDIGDEKQPHVVSNLRLQVNQPADHAAASGDPGASSPVQGYAAHYCNVPTRIDPQIVACSFITSGLRVFDVSDLTAPKEIAYFAAPTRARAENGLMASNFAMSQPAFDSARHQIWYSDGASGFYNLQVDPAVWPKDVKPCKPATRFTFTAHVPRGAKVRTLKATVAGKRVKVSRKGRALRVVVDLRKQAGRTVHLTLRLRTRAGRTVTTKRTYRTCDVTPSRLVGRRLRQPEHREHARGVEEGVLPDDATAGDLEHDAVPTARGCRPVRSACTARMRASRWR